MSSANNSQEVTFRFGPDPQEAVTNANVLIRNNQGYIVIQINEPGKTLRFDSPPPSDNGMVELIFNEAYHPLVLFFYENKFFIPQKNDSGNPVALTELPSGNDTKIFVFPIIADLLPGTVTVNPYDNDVEIGLVIVGTSGLDVPAKNP